MRYFIKRWLGFAGLLLLLAGCAPAANRVSVESRRPASRPMSKGIQAGDAPEATRSSTQSLDTAVETAELPDVLTLEQARQTALRANPDVHAAQARVEQALARIDEARSRYFPGLALVHNSSRQFLVPASSTQFLNPFVPQSPTLNTNIQSSTDLFLEAFRQLPLFGNRSIDSGNSNAFSQHSTNLALTWTLFDGFARDARLLAAKRYRESAAAGLDDVRRLLVNAVDAAYYQSQLGLEQLRVAKADEQFSKDQVTDAQKRFEAGKVRADEVQSFQVRMMTAQAEVTSATGLYEMGRTLLAVLMGIPEAKLPEATSLSGLEEEGADALTAPDETTWISMALEQRPDLHAVVKEFHAAEANVRVAKAQFSPILNLTGSYGFDRISNVAYSEDDQASAAAVELNFPLFTGGFRTSQLHLALAQRNEQEEKVRSQRIAVVRDVRQAIIALRDAQEQVRLKRATLELAEENRRIVAQEYSLGKVALERLDLSQRDYTATDADLARSRIQLRQAWSDLRAAAGQNLETGY